MRFSTETYQGWGRAMSATAEVARPERASALGPIIADCQRVLPIGGLRSYGDTALAANGHALRTERLDRLIDFDPQTGILEAQAGITLGEILRVMGPQGWMPAVMPGTGFASLGGAISNDVHGKNHHAAGSFGQHVESFDLIGADGQTQRVTPQGAPELFKATVGGVGQTGVIASARIRLAHCPSALMDIQERQITGLSEFFEAFDAASEPYQVGWIDALATGSKLGRGIFEAADFAGPGMTPSEGAKSRSLPFQPPGFALSAPIVRAFNAAYLWRIPDLGRRVIRPLEAFFFPLDAITNWNKLYGKTGFHQFQCVLPDEAARAGLTLILTRIAEAGIASPLAVIKKMGPGRAGFLSFPMEGMTLAVDLPNKPRALSVLNDVNRIALDHGGRVYLAKDSSLDRSTFAGMYDELESFQEAVAKADPGGKFASRMSERLDLRGAQ